MYIMLGRDAVALRDVVMAKRFNGQPVFTKVCDTVSGVYNLNPSVLYIK